ncbi:MAG: hypothetical protein HY901_19565 [Deltaproteobacteria bacterium]|nr:hypothetical protein [Deltaproteobacteria bacterium]
MSQDNLTLRYAFSTGQRKAKGEIENENDAAPALPRGHIPRIARLVALAHKFQAMINAGTVESMAELARLGHVTPARITQIMDLLLLAPDIQEALLFLPPVERGHDPIHLRELRYVCQTPIWAEQRARWLELKDTLPTEVTAQPETTAANSSASSSASACRPTTSSQRSKAN